MESFAGARIGVANRGIPALRIGRTIHEMGGIYVAFFTQEDKTAPHVALADRAISLRENSYLNIDEFVDHARRHGLRGVHPGWGFAAEDASFPQQCREAGIVFVGPSTKAMTRLGNKVRAIQTAKEAGVPVVPGSGAAVDLDEARRVAEELTYPILIKSEGGGGGRGIKLVRSPEELERQFRSAATMAETSSGNPNLFIEKFLEQVRHLEIQVLRDRHGNAVALHERDCSLQRKNQKLLEVTPSPWAGATPALRQKLKDAALTIVHESNYDSIATIEFLVDPDGNYYFIEANTRLQVEHGITELIYGIDLVEEMIRIAFGHKLSERLQTLEPRGFSLQCRINFEDPQNNFQPNAGKILRYLSPGGGGVRLDSCVYGGYEFPKAYDSAGALVMTYGATWSKALAVMQRALSKYIITGPRTTIPFHRQILDHEAFAAGEFDTKFIERTADLMEYHEVEPEHVRLSYLLAEITAHGYNPYLSLGPYRRFGDSKQGAASLSLPNVGDVAQEGSEYPAAQEASTTGTPSAATAFESVAESEPSTTGERVRERRPTRRVYGSPQLDAPYTPPFDVRAHRSETLRAFRESPYVELCNTTPRDITQSDSSNRMRLFDDRLYGPYLDRCGYAMVENAGGAHYHVNMIGNLTDPWREAAEWNVFAPHTPKLILVRSTNLLGYAPQDRVVMQRTTEMIVRHFHVVRCFDFLNHIVNMEPLAKIVIHDERRIFAPAISFSWADGFTAEHYGEVLEEIITMVAGLLGSSREDASREIILVIKDMAGVAPPRFVREVVTVFRKRYPDLIVQYHRHNTDGLGVPALGAAAEAGAKILDVGDGPAVRFYGQPAVLPTVAYLEGELGLKTRVDIERIRETGVVLKQIMPIYDRYVRPTFLGPDHDVIHHGLPGGATSSSQEAAMKQGYAFLLPHILVVLELCRKIIRYHDVTPGSQITWTNGYLMVVRAYERGGNDEVERIIDLLRRVANTPETDLSPEDVGQRSVLFAHANDSLRNLLMGKFGRLPLGWPSDWVYESVFGGDAARVIAERSDASPLLSLPSTDLEGARDDLQAHIKREPNEEEFVNYLNHPGDAIKLIKNRDRFGCPNTMPDDLWFEGLELGEEREFRTGDGKIHTIEASFIDPEIDETGCRTIRYELDGETLEHRVQVEEPREAGGELEMADPQNPNHIGAPFDADLWVVYKKAGDQVTEGDEILSLSLMKMETSVTTPVSGVVRRVLVHANYAVDRKMVPVKKGQLLLELAAAGGSCEGCSAPLDAMFLYCPQCGKAKKDGGAP